MNECLNNVDWFNLISTLIGAVVGGILALYASVFVSKRESRRDAELKRVKEIYTPLYEELIKRNEYAKKSPYSESLANLPSRVALPSRQVWIEIKSDARRIDVPKKIEKTMENLYAALSAYSSMYNAFCEDMRSNAQHILEEETGTRPGDSVAMSITIEALNSIVKNNADIEISNRLGQELFISKENISQIKNRLFRDISDSLEFIKIEQKRKHWVKLEIKAIKCLERSIRKAKKI